jgi:hypothetical protein
VGLKTKRRIAWRIVYVNTVLEDGRSKHDSIVLSKFSMKSIGDVAKANAYKGVYGQLFVQVRRNIG